MKKLKYGLLGGAAALAMAMTLPALAHAEPGKGGHIGKLFEMADTDKDGAISQAEFRAGAEVRFDAMDKDGDGVLTKEEMKAAHEEMREKFKAHRGERLDPAERFAKLDADGDGKVTLDEMKESVAKRLAERGKDDDKADRHVKFAEKHFEKMDADGDGAVTLEEMKAAKTKHHGERADKKDGKRGDYFSRLDTDGDGAVTKDEFLASADKMFEKLDRNSDGKIERGEGRKDRAERKDR